MRTALRALKRAIALVGVVGLVGGVAGPAGAQPVDPPPSQGRTNLTLVVVPNNGTARVASLSCEPPGGSHPNAAGACRDLAAARGNFAELPGDPDMDACIEIYDPVTVFALGLWRGQPVWYGYRYGNSCILRAATGPVFALAGGTVTASG
jgi:hypothetical protein